MPMDPGDFIQAAFEEMQEKLKAAFEAENAKRMYEFGDVVREFSVAPTAPCLMAEDQMHDVNADCGSAVSLVAPGRSPLGMEITLGACVHCGAGIFGLAPYNHKTLLRLQVFGIAIPDDQASPDGEDAPEGV